MDNRKSGYIAHLEFDKRGGWLRLDTDFRALSPDLEINDLGYRRRADMLEWNYDVTARKEKPFSIFRRVIFGLYGWRTWNYDGVNISSYSEIWTDGRLKNYWDYDIWVGRNHASFDDDDVRRGGTLIKNPPGWWVFTNLSTDSRKMVQLRLNPIFRWDDDGRTSLPENVENDNVVFGLRRETFNHQQPSPNALRTTKNPRRIKYCRESRPVLRICEGRCAMGNSD